MSFNPDQVPLAFFRALQNKDYVPAWQSLSQRSQDYIVRLLASSWKEHSVEELTEMFEKGQSVAKTYWEQFSKSVELSTWLEQSYRQLGVSGNEVIVKAAPSGVNLMVYRENNAWKFGYIETFLDFQ